MSARRPVRIALAGLGVIVASLLLASLWLIGTVAGTGFLLTRLQSVLGGKLAIESHAGTLAGPLILRGLRYDDPDAGVALTLGEARIDVSVRRLLTGRVAVQDARFEGLRLRLSEPRVPPPDDDTPFTLESPVDVVVRRLELRDARIERDGEMLVDIRSALLSADWIGPELRLRQLDLLASDGEVHLAGRVREDGRYAGDATGRFRWQLGERRLAGTLDARADADGTTATLGLVEPMRATLALTLDQGGDWPWTWRLEVPRFDPRESLLPEASLRQLAATLEGRGTLQAGTTAGHVELDGTRIDITRLAYARRETDWDLDGELALGRGRLQLAGVVHGAAEPLAAEFDLDWRDLDLPASLVGQALRTAGKLRVEGSSDRYSAGGALQLGPPGRLADIRLKLDGTPQRIRLEELAVLQRSGRLTASGTVELPEAGPRWALTATARGFDPGEFFADWPGRLDFALTTDGRLEAEQPQGRLVISNLGGRLRGRPIAGQSDLRLAADRSMAGRLELRSGGSRVTLAGTQGADGSARAVLDLKVATLADWLPGAAGRVDADFTATGRWPAVEITGKAVAGDVVSGDVRLASARVDASVARPLDPRGRITLDARGLASAGFTADHVTLTADGDAASHRLEMRVDSPDVDAALDLTGARQADRWQGQLTRLDIAVPDVAALRLQQPVALAYSPAAASLSEACLADGAIRLCVTGSRRADGALEGRYRVRALPLALATRLAAPGSPVGVDGLLDGDGDVRRDVAGRLEGRASLRVAAARIEQWIDGEEPQVLLRVADFTADATLAGTDGELTLAMRLDDDGRLAGRLAASGIGTAATPLDGRLTLSLPRLTVIEALLPQLTEVKGELTVDATIGGTLDAPVPGGELRVAGFAAQVPGLGLKLRDGRASVKPDGPERFRLDGAVSSGTGSLTFAGSATPAPTFDLRIEGSDFLAADIPGVRAEVSPRLTVTRDAEVLAVTGDVQLPKAAIDLQRLPGTARTREASPDVVILDAEVTAARETSVPIRADVAILLGEDVKVTGYGLDAKVEGRLAVRERSGGATLASGEIRVSGGYKAYGQDLTIRQGQLLYAATPLDDPRLAIVAVREVGSVTAGLRVGGSARTPQLTVFSDPAMGEANALSYLVAGKPLDQVGQSQAEGDRLQSAARQLGTAAGGLLAKNIGQRLGVDELGIQESAALGGAALTVGQYLSPKLYLSYGLGLFEPGNVLTLRYRLSKELALEAEQANRNSRAGVQLRLER